MLVSLCDIASRSSFRALSLNCRAPTLWDAGRLLHERGWHMSCEKSKTYTVLELSSVFGSHELDTYCTWMWDMDFGSFKLRKYANHSHVVHIQQMLQDVCYQQHAAPLVWSRYWCKSKYTLMYQPFRDKASSYNIHTITNDAVLHMFWPMQAVYYAK